MTTKLITTEKNLAVIEVTVPQGLVLEHRQESIEHLAHGVTIKGFRKGKAPLNLVENQLDPQKITEHTLDHLVPELVSQSIKEHQLKVIGSPHLAIKSAKPNSDWVFEIKFPLLPEIKLGSYQEDVKTINAKTKIIVPGKVEVKPEDQEAEQLNQIFDKLLATIKFDVPQTLIDAEVNQSLSRLLNQTQKLGLGIEDYLKTLGKTSEELKGEYEKAATDNIRLELILEAIADDLKLTVTDSQMQELINATASAEAKQKLDNPREHEYIKAILRKRKTIDALLRL